MKRCLILPAVEEEERRDQLKRVRVVFLFPRQRSPVSRPILAYLYQPVDNLFPHIVRVGAEDIRCEQFEQTPRDIEFRAQVIICCSLRQLGRDAGAGGATPLYLVVRPR